jgi:hypothetical protein
VVEIVQDHGSPGIPVDDRRDLGRDAIGLSAGDPLTQKRIVWHLAARTVGQVVAEQVTCGAAAVVGEMVREELCLGL